MLNTQAWVHLIRVLRNSHEGPLYFCSLSKMPSRMRFVVLNAMKKAILYVYGARAQAEGMTIWAPHIEQICPTVVQPPNHLPYLLTTASMKVGFLDCGGTQYRLLGRNHPAGLPKQARGLGCGNGRKLILWRAATGTTRLWFISDELNQKIKLTSNLHSSNSKVLIFSITGSECRADSDSISSWTWTSKVQDILPR